MLNYKIPELTDIIFNTELDVRIYDLNYGQHLGHDSLISLLHEARVKFLKSHGYTEFDICGLGILISNLVVNYLGESFYSDKLEINIGIGEINKTRMDSMYQVIASERNKEIARALTTLTFYDYRIRKVARIPKEFLSKIISQENMEGINS